MLKRWRNSILAIGLSLLALWSGTGMAQPLPPALRTADEKAFLAALAELQRGHQQQFLVIADRLRHYPLYPYLLYADLAVHLPEATPAQIQGFLNAYQNTPLEGHLRDSWLMQLANQQQWRMFLAVYHPVKDIGLQCLQREALLATGHATEAFDNLGALLGKNQLLPHACIPIFNAALQSGGLGQNMLWQRINLAMQANNLALAQQMSQFLPVAQREHFLLWQAVYHKPQLILQPGLLGATGELTQAILMTGMQRLSEQDPHLAVRAWQRLTEEYHFPQDMQQKAAAVLGVSLAQAHDPEAEHWFIRLLPSEADSSAREWRVRAAIVQQNWPLVAKTIALLTPEEQKTPEWRYWLARALAGSGQAQSAQNIYHELALHGDFYGQLASLWLREPPLVSIRDLQVSRSQIAALGALPAMQRAHELYLLNWLPEAHQEWQWALRELPEDDYLAAAELALSWGWYEQGISTVNLINDGRNISLRFPLAYRTQILSAAHTAGLNPAWVFALVRQESLFTPYAHSGAGAIGLMQLLPSTAMLMAGRLHWGVSPGSLLDANINLALGSLYLKRLSVLFNGNAVLATAAYNAGPGRVQKWLPVTPMEPDIWIETIPWHETRNYVKNIMAATTFYEKELGLPSTLNRRIQVVSK